MTSVLHGIAVSPGIAAGTALVLDDRPVELPAASIASDEVLVEIDRFARARREVRGELEDLRRRIRESLGDGYARMLEFQMLMLDDPSLIGETERRIARDRIRAAAALRASAGEFIKRFESVEDEHFRESGRDLEDVRARLERRLTAGAAPATPPAGDRIVVARSLGPADTLALAREGVLAIAADLGGPTSHLAILAKALGLPAVIGLGDATRRIANGSAIVVDGDAGTVEIAPTAHRLSEAARRRENRLLAEATDAAAALPAASLDGIPIAVRANIELPEELPLAVRLGAEGIGLYRSEFLFVSQAPRIPDEEAHYRAYRELADAVAGQPVIVRTFDLGGEKYFQTVLTRGEPNPVLGARGLRFCLKRPDLFRPQLRALVRAAAHGDIRILLPLVTRADEIREVRRILAEEADALSREGNAARRDVPVGAMVETPAAALSVARLAREADFLSLGTNDLIQYALAVDRGNPEVAPLYDPLHPAILRLIAAAVRDANAAGIPISICGEMAADPALVGWVLGLGLEDLSVPPRAIATVREAIRRVHRGQAEAEVASLLGETP